MKTSKLIKRLRRILKTCGDEDIMFAPKPLQVFSRPRLVAGFDIFEVIGEDGRVVTCFGVPAKNFGKPRRPRRRKDCIPPTDDELEKMALEDGVSKAALTRGLTDGTGDSIPWYR